ncbi:MAG: bifunctional phosphopantothenoylcysteine decarboxylase/phosphopantothenate--cysteine ligase CoaBC [Candidatus Zixiibacteriota bacterium]
MSVTGKRVVVGLTGGIACYKVPYFVRAMVKAGAEVQVIMTQAATKFITPLTMETVSRNPVCIDLFPEHEFVSTRHINLADWGDLFVIAPATANFLGKIANGISDDLLTTTVCATKSPVLIAPAMNPHMWSNPVTVRNYEYLKQLGYLFIGPAEGEMAEKQFGVGRMVEPDELYRAVLEFFEGGSKKKALTGKRILVTAGPCREPIDPVRYLSNRSSGKMGYALAEAAVALGADVTLISGPTPLAAPHGVRFVAIETTRQLHEAVKQQFASCDCLIMAAAPADFTVSDVASQKIKRTDKNVTLSLCPVDDILQDVASDKRAGQVVVGFALETDNDIANAQAKLERKNLDLIVVNNPTEAGAGFEYDTNRVTLIQAGQKPEPWPLMSKRDVASRLIDRIVDLMFSNAIASGKRP